MFKHPKTYKTSDFEAYDTTENSKDFNLLGILDITRGEAESLGRGYDSTQQNAEGRIAAEIVDGNGAAVGGRMQFALMTPQNKVIRVINEFDLEEVAPPSSGDRGDRYPFPIQEMTEDGSRVFKSSPYKLGLFVQTDGSGNGTLDLAASTLKADGQRAERTS